MFQLVLGHRDRAHEDYYRNHGHDNHILVSSFLLGLSALRPFAPLSTLHAARGTCSKRGERSHELHRHQRACT